MGDQLNHGDCGQTINCDATSLLRGKKSGGGPPEARCTGHVLLAYAVREPLHLRLAPLIAL